jgi:hypothetical protein
MKKAAKRYRGAGWRGWVDCSFGLALALFAANSAFAGGQPELTLRVRVYDYAKVPSGFISRAESEAGRIFAVAGVHTIWMDCQAPQVQVQLGPVPAEPAEAACVAPLKDAIVLLRMLPRSAPASTVPDTMFGFATGDMASVFYGRVEDFASDADFGGNEIPLILGDVVAHELGHVLLGTNSHSPAGIMRANWDREHVRRAFRGGEIFSPQESALIRATVARRSIENGQP